MATGSAPPRALQELVGRYDADVADFPAGRARVRLDVRGGETWDAIAGRRRATLERANGSKADAWLAADEQTWAQIAADVRTGMAAFGAGRLEPDALFVWGRQDRLVPIAFAPHVSETAPGARHLALNCGHVPQLERPRETHRALIDFLGAA